MASALAVALASLSRWTPPVDRRRRPGPPARDRAAALGFVVLGITYLNLRKNVGQWVKFKAVPAEMVGHRRERLVRPGIRPRWH